MGEQFEESEKRGGKRRERVNESESVSELGIGEGRDGRRERVKKREGSKTTKNNKYAGKYI